MPEDWAPSFGEATIARRSACPGPSDDNPQVPVLYCSWFCPFAQRAWIAMEAKGVEYHWEEIVPYEVDPSAPGGYTKKQLPLAEKRKLYPSFTEASPRGLIPAIRHGSVRGADSLPLVEYIDEAFAGPKLLPEDAASRLRVRMWAVFCTERVQRSYYRMLMSQDPTQQQECMQTFFYTCRELAKAFDPVDTSVADGAGAFFLGAQFSLFDIALAPFWQRFLWVGPHYRPFFKLPAAEDDEDFARLHAWWRATRNHPAVKATLVCKPRLVASYADYTVNKGTSDFAQGMQASLKPRASTDDSGTGAGQGAGAGSHK